MIESLEEFPTQREVPAEMACEHIDGMYAPTHDMEPEYWLQFQFCPKCGVRLRKEAE